MEGPSLFFWGRQTGVRADWRRRESNTSKSNYDRRSIEERGGRGCCGGGRDSDRGRQGKHRCGDGGGGGRCGGEPDPQDGRLCRVPLQARRSRVAQKGRNERRRCQGRVRLDQGPIKRSCLQVNYTAASLCADLCTSPETGAGRWVCHSHSSFVQSSCDKFEFRSVFRSKLGPS